MATQTNLKVVFGYTGTDGIAMGSSFVGTFSLQSHTYEPHADEKQIMSADGALANRIFHNPSRKATVEVIPWSTGALGVAGTVGVARTNKSSLLALIRTIVNVTVCDDAPELVGDHWFVVDAKAAGSNVGEHKVTLSLEEHAGITHSAT